MNFLKMLKCCLNPKVIVGVAVVIAPAYFFVPQLAQYSWVLIALICPLSMIVMIAMMNKKEHNGERETMDPKDDAKI